MKLKFSGVYAIRHIASNKRYVGSAICIETRWRDHRKALNRSTHYNIKLQRAWNRYGEDKFQFEILDLCLPIDLLACEQEYINEHAEFNILPIAGSRLGMEHSNATRKKISDATKRRMMRPEHRFRFAKRMRELGFSEMARIKMSNSQKERHANDPKFLKKLWKAGHTKLSNQKRSITMLGNQHLLGHKHSEATRMKMSISQKIRMANPKERQRFFATHSTLKARRNYSLAMLGNQRARKHYG